MVGDKFKLMKAMSSQSCFDQLALPGSTTRRLHSVMAGTGSALKLQILSLSCCLLLPLKLEIPVPDLPVVTDSTFW